MLLPGTERSGLVLLFNQLLFLLVGAIRRRAVRTGLLRSPVLVPADDIVGQKMISTATYEHREFDAIRAGIAGTGPLRLDASGAFIDVGANLGLYTLVLAPSFAATLALEPHPITFRLLEANVMMNRVPRVTCMRIGASDSTGDATIHVSTEGQLGYSSIGEAVAFDSVPETVEIDRLDSILERALPGQRVALIKLDIEGHELNAIRGAEAILRRDAPVVLFETLTPEAGRACIAFLTACGYVRFLYFRRAFAGFWPPGRTATEVVTFDPGSKHMPRMIWAAPDQTESSPARRSAPLSQPTGDTQRR